MMRNTILSSTSLCTELQGSKNQTTIARTAVPYSSKNIKSNKIIKNNLASLPLPFPWKLYQLLEDSEKNGTQNIISWLPEGESFAVRKPPDFAKTMMSSYFRLGSYQSFIREVSSIRTNGTTFPQTFFCSNILLFLFILQLDRYGFRRINSDNEEGVFQRPRYLRQDKSSCLSLRRKCTTQKASTCLET
jgi:hypothetical protein